MAEERQVTTTSKISKTPAAPAPKKAAAKAPAAAGTVARLRSDLSTARRDLALQKLDSPVKIRQLRKDLARALTAERATALAKEAA